MRLSKRRSLREENRLWNHPGHRSSPSPVSFQLCDLDKQLPFSEVQHFHQRAHNTPLERLLEQK